MIEDLHAWIVNHQAVDAENEPGWLAGDPTDPGNLQVNPLYPSDSRIPKQSTGTWVAMDIHFTIRLGAAQVSHRLYERILFTIIILSLRNTVCTERGILESWY
jgi:hypothetical protein